MKSRHPELVSGPISPLKPKLRLASNPRGCVPLERPALKARWVLKQVQHDDEGEIGRLC